MKHRKLIPLNLHSNQETLVQSNHQHMIKKMKRNSNYQKKKLSSSIF